MGEHPRAKHAGNGSSHIRDPRPTLYFRADSGLRSASRPFRDMIISVDNIIDTCYVLSALTVPNR